MSFNNIDLFKPLCAGHINGTTGSTKVASVGKVDFNFVRGSQGNYIITFATPLPDNNYIVQINPYSNGGGQYYVGTKTASQFDIQTRTSGGNLVDMQIVFNVLR